MLILNGKKFFTYLESAFLTTLLVSGIILLLSGASKTGVSTDEPYYLESTQNFLKEGWYLPDGYLEQLKEGDVDNPNKYVYGPIPDIFSHQINKILGHEENKLVSDGAEAYQVRHLTISSLFLIFILLTYLFIKNVTHENRFALLAVVILLSIPELVGHAMFNQKDLSVAVGVTLFTYSLVWLQQNRLSHFFTYGMIGLILSIGSRPGIWILLLTLIVGASVFNIYIKKSISVLLKYFLFIVTLLVVGFLVLILIYPNLYANFYKFLSKSFSSSSRYWAYHDTLTNGRIEKYPISARYIPEWLVTELPMGLLIIFCISVFYLGIKIIRNRLNKTESIIDLTVFLLFIQVLLIPIYITIFGSNLYSGLRQILFIFPAIGLLIVFSIYRLDKDLKKKTLKTFLALGFYIYLSYINFEQWRIAPYSYIYVSEIRTQEEVNGKWPTDFWRLSYKELVPRVSQSGLAVCNPFLLENGQHKDEILRGWPFTNNNNCNEDPRFKPFLESIGIKNKNTLENDLQYWYIRSNEFGYNIPKNCQLADQISRNLRSRNLMLSYLAVCEYPLEELKADQFEIDEFSQKYLINGWSASEENWIWSLDENAYIAFKLPNLAETNQVKISLQGALFAEEMSSRGLKFEINNEEIKYEVVKNGNKSIYNLFFVPKRSMYFEDTVVIKISTSNPISPKELGLGDDERRLGFRLEYFSLGMR